MTVDFMTRLLLPGCFWSDAFYFCSCAAVSKMLRCFYTKLHTRDVTR